MWVSEVMLQQTQIETVLPYYLRFLEKFPTLDSLAAAPEDAVLRSWAGLGYYNRARNFRKAALRVVTDHDGKIPSSYDELLRLPGVGRYMAGAILSIAFNQPYPLVDGNVRRVLSRYHGWREPVDRQVWDEATRLVARGVPRDLNQGMMELGATVCTLRSPECSRCPWQSGCVGSRTGTAAEIPVPKKRPRTVRVDLVAIVDVNAEGLLMRDNQGLWEFPLLARLPTAGGLRSVGHCRHAITHHRVEVDVYIGRLESEAGYERVRFEEVPVTSLTRKIYALAHPPPDGKPDS